MQAIFLSLAFLHLPAILLHSPDACILLLTLGLALIYLELNRPGSILPGAAGLLAFLLAVAGLSRFPLNAVGLVLVVSAAALLLLGLRRNTTVLTASAATLALVLGLASIVSRPSPERVHIVTAVLCGLVIGAGTSILTRIAKRARTNKGLD